MLNEEELAPKNDKEEKKPRLDLIPMDLMGLVADTFDYGTYKYSRNSWRKGFYQSGQIAAARRHISNYWDEGKDFDEEAEVNDYKIHHIAMAIFNLITILDSVVNHPELDDRYKKPEPEEI